MQSAKSFLINLLSAVLACQIMVIVMLFLAQQHSLSPLPPRKVDLRALHRERLRRKKVGAPKEVFLCVAAKNIRPNMISTLHGMVLPPHIPMHLLLLAPHELPPWTRGRSALLAKMTWAAPRDACFIVVVDGVSADPGPFLVYWFWRMCSRRRNGSRLLSGDANGTTFVSPSYDLWMRRGADCIRSPSSVVVYPPIIDGCVLARSKYQSLLEHERSPRLARVWHEGFVNRAITLKLQETVRS